MCYNVFMIEEGLKMTVDEKALNFAINAHKGQVRKSEPDKPMIFHPINVGNILKEYGYDENVVAAGFLHDVVEDTIYTIEDIKKEFGDDIASLVLVRLNQIKVYHGKKEKNIQLKLLRH